MELGTRSRTTFSLSDIWKENYLPVKGTVITVLYNHIYGLNLKMFLPKKNRFDSSVNYRIYALNVYKRSVGIYWQLLKRDAYRAFAMINDIVKISADFRWYRYRVKLYDNPLSEIFFFSERKVQVSN